MTSYIINTDPAWLSFLVDNGIKNPVFWLKRGNSPNKKILTTGNPIFFRITKSNPPVIKGMGIIGRAYTTTLENAFLSYGNRLGYKNIAEMIDTSSNWTSGVELRTSTIFFCIEIEKFQIIGDIRTDIDLPRFGIDFDYRHVVTGKGLDDTQTLKLLEEAKKKLIYKTSHLESFFRENVAPYAEDEFDPENIQDAREKTARTIFIRRGQSKFRKKLIDAYEAKCAFSRCDALPALEAAHIIPYKGDNTNHVSNGLLLMGKSFKHCQNGCCSILI